MPHTAATAAKRKDVTGGTARAEARAPIGPASAPIPLERVEEALSRNDVEDAQLAGLEERLEQQPVVDAHPHGSNVRDRLEEFRRCPDRSISAGQRRNDLKGLRGDGCG